MTCGPELSGWAGRILETIPETGYTSTGKIVNYFQYNLYKLNSALYTEFTLSGDCIVPDLNQAQSGIYEQMYRCDYLAQRVMSSLGAASYDWIELEMHDQSRIRRVAQTTVAQGYKLQSDECKLLLKGYIDRYNDGQFGTVAGMVIYQERGPNTCILPQEGWRVDGCCNTVFGGGAYLV